MPFDDCSRADDCPPCVNEPDGSASSLLDECPGLWAGRKHCFIHGAWCCHCGIEQPAPADAETAGEPEAFACAVPGGTCRRPEDCAYGCRQAADDLTRLGQEMEATEPEAPECDHQCHCGIGTWKDCAMQPWGCAHDGGGAPIRRPPYAVAYVLQDGTHFEVALPGDATVCALDGALLITHTQSPVQGLTQARPMEG